MQYIGSALSITGIQRFKHSHELMKRVCDHNSHKNAFGIDRVREKPSRVELLLEFAQDIRRRSRTQLRYSLIHAQGEIYMEQTQKV